MTAMPPYQRLVMRDRPDWYSRLGSPLSGTGFQPNLMPVQGIAPASNGWYPGNTVGAHEITAVEGIDVADTAVKTAMSAADYFGANPAPIDIFSAADHTWEIWFYQADAEKNTAQGHMLIASSHPADGKPYMYFGEPFGNVKLLTFNPRGNTAGGASVQNSGWEYDRWNHVAFLWDNAAGVAKIWCNGAFRVTSGALGALGTSPTFGPLLGLWYRGTSVWGAQRVRLDEFAHYSRQLTENELLSHWKEGQSNLTPPAPLLVREPLRPDFRVQAEAGDGRAYDLTPCVEDLAWSNVNPGGDEQASFKLRRSWFANNPDIRKGNLLRITGGLDSLFHGRLEEVDRRGGDDGETVDVVGYGMGARLKDATMMECYICRSLGEWVPPTLNHRLALTAGGGIPLDADFTARADEQALTFGGPKDRAIPNNSRAILMFVMPEGLKAAEIQYKLEQSNYTAAYGAQALFATDDDTLGSGSWESYALTSGGALQSRVLTTAARRFLMLMLNKSGATTPANAVEATYRQMAVFGDHGLTRKDNGDEPDGLGGRDIVADIIARCPGIIARTIDDSGFVIDHLTFFDPTSFEDAIREVDEFEHADWGTWGPSNAFDRGTSGYFDFKQPDSTTQHWLARRSDFDDLDLHSELSTLFNVAEVTYTTPEGTELVLERTAVVPDLDNANPPIIRVLEIDAGEMTTSRARMLGDFALAIGGGYAPARGGGGLVMPVTHYRRGKIAPWYMRADGSNLRVLDALPSTTLFALDDTPDRRTTFPLKRVSVQAAVDQPRVSVEFDQTNDKLSQMQAQLGLAISYREESAGRRKKKNNRPKKKGRR